MKLIFSSIKNETIFEPEFQGLTPDVGTIEFKHLSAPGGIAVVYAPNGTGKSSLTKVLESETISSNRSFMAKDDCDQVLSPQSKAFHIIPDQINRNVIRGKETDYLVGQQIRREYELRDKINTAFDAAYSSLSGKYKSDFKVSKVGDYLLTQIGEYKGLFYRTAFSYLRSIINTKSHGKDINQAEFVSFIRNADCEPRIIELDDKKRAWIIEDCAGKAKITERVIGLNYHNIATNEEIIQIERFDDAIGILKKYHSLSTCVVCDNHDFHGDDLLTKKQNNRKRIYDQLDRSTKELLEKVVKDSSLSSTDPFEIKRIVAECCC